MTQTPQWRTTHCPAGHALAKHGRVTKAGNSRQCRECERLRAKAERAAAKEAQANA